LLIVDSTNVTEIPETKAEIRRIPFTETAKKAFGEVIYANIIMLGVLAKVTGVVTEQAIERALIESVPKKMVATNLRAFRKGLQL
jgi:2-oxoglutarate ferredoxin oxidoreductase subunit gamma